MNVSYVVTLYNKAAFLPLVVAALAAEGGDFTRDYIFVDDGSTDDTVAVLRSLASQLPGAVTVIERQNGGASAATNDGVLAARGPWLRLVDGDDLVTQNSTVSMLAAANEAGLSFAYGDLGTYDPDTMKGDAAVGQFAAPEYLRNGAGLSRFIRNCPANSSSILVTRDHYLQVGGCDERLISPDQMLFLRLFTNKDGIHLPGPVALIPKEAPGRLSGQIRRSRYESVLALLTLLTDTPALPERFRREAYRRALTRANTYAILFSGQRLASPHFWYYLASKFQTPRNPTDAMRRALSAFTEDGSTERPDSWKPGAMRRGIARTRVG